MPQIVRKLEFDAGHRILKHESKCKHLHGHRYVAEISCYCTELDSIGRVIDFGVVKDIVGKWIDDNWDHNMLLHSDDVLLKGDEYVASELCGREPYVFQNCNPTAEVIAERLLMISQELLANHGIKVRRVKLFETPNCWAIASTNWSES